MRSAGDAAGSNGSRGPFEDVRLAQSTAVCSASVGPGANSMKRAASGTSYFLGSSARNSNVRCPSVSPLLSNAALKRPGRPDGYPAFVRYACRGLEANAKSALTIDEASTLHSAMMT
jgi:hypothetical protein